MSVNSFSGQPAIPTSYGFTAGKNKIINGDFGVWQRGTSFNPAGNFTSDRWANTGSGSVVTRQTFTPGTAPVSGYEAPYYLNWTLNSNQQNNEMLQRIEDARTFAGQTVTLSFWARSTVGAQPLNVAIYQNFGTGGSPSTLTSATLTSGTSAYTPTSSWQRFSFTFSVPSVAGKTFGTNNDSYLWVRVAQFTTTATNTSLDIWGVQLEAGSVATAFQTATGTIQGELAACQRYYWRQTAIPGVSAYTTFATGMASSTTVAAIPIFMPVTMRAYPTVLDYSTLRVQDTANGYTVTALSFDSNFYGYNSIALNATVASGLTQFRTYTLGANNSGSAYIGLSAEL